MARKNFTLAFLLQGKVQKVKMRRYIESAARHFGVGGYVINTDNGHVFGEAWVSDNHQLTLLRNFQTWICGEYKPAIFTNVKPTPIGTAYPDLAVVERCLVLGEDLRNISEWMHKNTQHFVMVRDDQEAAMIAWERRQILDQLAAESMKGGTSDPSNCSSQGTAAGDREVLVCSWPKR